MRRGVCIIVIVAAIGMCIGAAAPPATTSTSPADVREMRRQRAAELAKQAAGELARKDFAAAVKTFQASVALDRMNAIAWIGYGDAEYAQAADDVRHLGRARLAWEEARNLEPRNAVPLRRLFEFYRDWADLFPTASVLEAFEQSARLLATADPNARDDVRTAIPATVVRAYVAGIDVDPAKRDAAMAELERWRTKRKDQADLPMFLAQAKFKLADAARLAGNVAEAQRLAGEAAAIMEAAVAASPSPAMHFAAAQVYAGRETAAREAADPAGIAIWRAKRRDACTAARQVLKDDDPLLPQIHLASAQALDDDPAAAEKILRQVEPRWPNDLPSRLALADLIAQNKNRRDEAIAILERPILGSSGMSGVRSMLLPDLKSRIHATAVSLRIDALATLPVAERADARAALQRSLDELKLASGEDARYCRLLGKLHRVDGKTLEAVQALEKARARYAADPASASNLERWETIDLLARTYIDANQIGQSKKLLAELLDRFPGYDPGRMLLAQILVKDGSHDEAREHVAYLKRKDPNNATVTTLELQIAAANPAAGGPVDSQREIYARLPEATQQQALDKINAAMVIEEHAEARRLLETWQAKSPGDYDLARMAVRVYRALGQPAKARESVEAALRVNPDDTRLQTLKRQVDIVFSNPSGATTAPAVPPVPPPATGAK